MKAEYGTVGMPVLPVFMSAFACVCICMSICVYMCVYRYLRLFRFLHVSDNVLYMFSFEKKIMANDHY